LDKNITNNFWQKFLKSTNKDESTKYYDCFYFSIEELADELLQLVLSGKKTATTSNFLSYGADELPKVGNLSIVLDSKENPHCVIETKAVTILPFKEITYDICKREGEDDTLESWQKNHWFFFTEDGKEDGYEFTEDSLVVFEDFEVIYNV